MNFKRGDRERCLRELFIELGDQTPGGVFCWWGELCLWVLGDKELGIGFGREI